MSLIKNGFGVAETIGGIRVLKSYATESPRRCTQQEKGDALGVDMSIPQLAILLSRIIEAQELRGVEGVQTQQYEPFQIEELTEVIEESPNL